MRGRHWLIGAAILALSLQVSSTAQAGLTGSVSALFYLGASAVPSVTSSTTPFTTPPPTEIEGTSTIPANFGEGVIDQSTIDVGDTTITITNESAAPFCSVSTSPCTDVFTGFGFVFSSDVDITDVTVDPASSPAFLPIASGLTFGADDIFANVAGDDPAVGGELILDVTTATVTSTVPEPASLTLLGTALVGFGAIRRRRKRV